MARKALGRGLNALLGEETQKSNFEELIEIDLDLIKPNSEQPRTSFEDDKLEELSQSIRANGIVQPIIVRKIDNHYQIVAGERRWRASQRANIGKIPAIIRDVSDDKLLELALIENIQREELNAIEEAKAYKNLSEKVGLTQETIAERVGKNRTVITTFLRLLKLPEDIQELIETGKISAGHGRALLMTDNIDSQRRIARNIMDSSLSVRETERAVKKTIKRSNPIPEKTFGDKKKNANIKAAETKLRRHFSTQVQIIPDGNGLGGKIEIEYYGESDLDRIYQLIMDK